jgi:hypothetical protein
MRSKLKTKLLRLIKRESTAHMRARLKREFHALALTSIKRNWFIQGKGETA